MGQCCRKFVQQRYNLKYVIFFLILAKLIFFLFSAENLVQNCSEKLLHQFLNVFQIRVDTLESQVFKACNCEYDKVTTSSLFAGAEKVSIDDFKHAYNCNPEISKHGTCINPMYHLKDLKLCALDLKGEVLNKMVRYFKNLSAFC